MLSKENRLKKNLDFQKVFKKGKSKYSSLLKVKYLFKNAKYPSRFGFIVSTKVDKRAAKRNLIKRQLRAVTKDLISKINPGYDVVVLASKINFPIDKNALRYELIKVYKEAGIYEENIYNDNKDISKNAIS